MYKDSIFHRKSYIIYTTSDENFIIYNVRISQLKFFLLLKLFTSLETINKIFNTLILF
jgi:hypothetical protein